MTEVGEALGVSPDRAYRLARADRLPKVLATYQVGRTWYCTRQSLRRFQNGEIEPTPVASAPPTPLPIPTAAPHVPAELLELMAYVKQQKAWWAWQERQVQAQIDAVASIERRAVS